MTEQARKADLNKAYWPKWYEKNKARRAEYARNYYQTHREEVDAKKERRRKLIMATGGQFNREQFAAMCVRFGNICLSCKKKTRLEVDHIVPLSQGGTHDESNIQPLCHACNVRKGTRTIDYR